MSKIKEKIEKAKEKAKAALNSETLKTGLKVASLALIGGGLSLISGSEREKGRKKGYELGKRAGESEGYLKGYIDANRETIQYMSSK